jgi:phosphatidylserine/phosphatidylglycerophosphate/cardiolipin synthase-like enzyme
MPPIYKSPPAHRRTPRKPLIAFCVALILLAGITGRVQGRDAHERPQPAYRAEIHFAPEENLENVDIPLIRAATSTVDVAMYTFTDRALAEALVTDARRGVHVRIYRDRGQSRVNKSAAAKCSGCCRSSPTFKSK